VFSGNGVDGNIFSPQLAGEGQHLISYVYTDSRGCISAAAKTVAVQICAGIDNMLNETAMKVYPNPFSDDVTIQFEGSLNSTVYLSLFDVNGKEILATQPYNMNARNEIILPMQYLEAGTYLLQVKYADAFETVRVVKTR
jgi:hypothetical protein